MIKIVHVQRSTKSAGGAALNLHNAFLESGFDSYIVTLYPDINDTERIIYPSRISKINSWLDDKLSAYILKNSNKEFGLFSFPVLGTDISKIRQIQEADIIYLHWVQNGFLNLSCYRNLAKLGKPIIIFMHDMWSITGGCHYSFTCSKYQSRCVECPVLQGHKKNDLSSKEYARKTKLYSDYDNFYFVTPSKWLYACAKQSSLTRDREIFHIPNIIDNSVFKPYNKEVARHILNLEPDIPVIAFGAVSINSPYKGWNYLQGALEVLKGDLGVARLSVLVFGKGNGPELVDMIPFNSKLVGYLHDKFSVSLVYNAADVFITPSLADNLPTTILESLSCGTPVVGFDVGGIPEMICHKENGYLARYRDPEDLANGIRYCLENQTESKLLPEFHKSVLMEKHMALINKVLK